MIEEEAKSIDITIKEMCAEVVEGSEATRPGFRREPRAHLLQLYSLKNTSDPNGSIQELEETIKSFKHSVTLMQNTIKLTRGGKESATNAEILRQVRQFSVYGL